MRLRNLFLRLWRKAFPIRYVLVYRHAETHLPPAIGADGEVLGLDDMLPELVNAYETCGPIFIWLQREIARLEKQYHAPAPHDPAALAIWHSTHEALNARILAHSRALRAPVSANMRILQLKEMAERKAAGEAERKALENFLTE